MASYLHPALSVPAAGVRPALDLSYEERWNRSADDRESAPKSARPLHVLLIEDCEDFADLIGALLTETMSFDVEWRARLADGIARLGEGGVDVVLLDLGLPDSRGLATLDRLNRAAPWVPVIVLTSDTREDVEMNAVANGAREFLVKQEVHASLLARAIRRAVYVHQAAGHAKTPTGTARAGEVVGMIGAKGGVGATTATLNLAAALAACKRSVIAVELDPMTSSFSHHLGARVVSPSPRLLSIPPEAISEREVSSSLSVLPCGIRVLAGASRAADLRDPAPERVERVLDAAARLADFVVADIPRWIGPATERILARCDRIYLVVDREPSSVAAAAAQLDVLQGRSVKVSRLSVLVVNRSPGAPNLAAPEIAIKLGYPFAGLIPEAAGDLLQSWRTQAPLVASNPDSLAAGSFLDLARKLLLEGAPAERRI